MEKKWIIRPSADAAQIAVLAEALHIDPALANLLVQRGVVNYDQAKQFFRPQLEDLHDPFLMKDMDRAVDRLEKAYNNKEHILVYGDYDVDGTTAVALVYSFLQPRFAKVSYFIPDRYKDGYGISFRGMDVAHQMGATLVVALDCGIKAVEKVEYAKSMGIDVIICDHHLPSLEIPDAAAVLDPKREDCSYPFSELSGCGVGFKMLQAYSQRNQIPFSELESLLDLVAVSIASDIVPLVDENRILAHYGLSKINQTPRKGLKAIIDSVRVKGKLTIDDIVFKIGPRINAAGRMDTGNAAVELLVCDDASKAKELAVGINTHNDDRKSVDRVITQEAIQMIETNPEYKSKRAHVLFNPKWHKGVVGIVASRLIETYYKPTIVLTESNGLATGSARSIQGFDLYQAVESCSDLLETFGGHTYAAGLTMKLEHVPVFIERFERYVAEKIRPDMLVPQVDIDAVLDFKEITPKFFRILRQFQPFGPGNMAPVFMSKKAFDSGHARLVGPDDSHLKLDLIQEENPYNPLSAIAFSQADYYDHIREGRPVDVCYSISENVYRGTSTLQLRIRDIRENQD